jgi:hypothetical protein
MRVAQRWLDCNFVHAACLPSVDRRCSSVCWLRSSSTRRKRQSCRIFEVGTQRLKSIDLISMVISPALGFHDFLRLCCNSLNFDVES